MKGDFEYAGHLLSEKEKIDKAIAANNAEWVERIERQRCVDCKFASDVNVCVIADKSCKWWRQLKKEMGI